MSKKVLCKIFLGCFFLVIICGCGIVDSGLIEGGGVRHEVIRMKTPLDTTRFGTATPRRVTVHSPPQNHKSETPKSLISLNPPQNRGEGGERLLRRSKRTRIYPSKKRSIGKRTITEDRYTAIPQLPQYENNFALIVGVSHYKNIPTLPYPEKDIGLMQEMATKIMGVKNNNLYVLRDPTKAEIISQIKKVTRLANCYNNSKVIFYFSGHGTAYAKKSGGKGEGYLLPIEADPEDISTTSVSLHEIEKLLARAKGKKVVIIDACFSGKGKSILLAGKPYIAIKKVTPIFHTTILLSSQETEISTYIKKKGISTFTYTLYEMLGRYGPILDKNKNGWVEAKEVTKKLRDFTDNYAVRFANKHQHPVIRGDLDISLAQHP